MDEVYICDASRFSFEAGLAQYEVEKVVTSLLILEALRAVYRGKCTLIIAAMTCHVILDIVTDQRATRSLLGYIQG